MKTLKVLLILEEIIKEKKKKLPEGSYTTRLFKKGVDSIVKKLGEEAVEVVIAVKSGKKEEIIYETADLLYHLIVTLVEAGVSLDEVGEELKRRMEIGKMKGINK